MAEAPPQATELRESTEISRKALDEALNAILAASLRPVCVGLALFYALLTAWYLVQYEGAAQTNMSLATGLLSFGLVVAAVWFERNQLPSWLAHPAAALIAAAVILNCLFSLVTLPQARQTTNLMIAQLGFGCLLLSVRWFVGLSLLALGGWVWVAGARTDDPDWNHFGLALCEATLFGGLVLFVRIRAYRNIQALRMRDQVLVHDLREANDAALCATRAKSEFLANMSHEIRTPMTAMLGMTELLQMTDLNEEQREFAGTIERSGGTLLQLVNDILDFSKIEAGQFQVEQVRFNLAQVLEEARDMLAVKAKQKHLPLLLEIDPSLIGGRYRGDPTRLKQVIVNLTGNAIKFTHEGHVKLSGRGVPLADRRVLIEISVEDTGIGIPEDQLEHVFEAFAQADASTTRKYGGTGLGLAISSRLTRLMGGEIKLHSELGKGSSFTVSLVLELAQNLTTKPPPSARSSARYEGRVLLVEDNEDTRALATEMLSRMGCRVDVAADGAQALSCLEHDSYDLVLMDCQMPNMNGYDATSAIRRREGERGHTTIVALSASVLPEERARCVEAGMDDYVAKPFSQRDLQRVLERWLDSRVEQAEPVLPRGAA